MSVWEAAAATALIAVLLYGADRGIAFHVCLYNAIAAGGRFQSDEAYKIMDNPFIRWPRVALGSVILIGTFVLALSGGMPEGEELVAVPLFGVLLAYGVTSWAYAVRAFRRTPFGAAMADAVEKGSWSKED